MNKNKIDKILIALTYIVLLPGMLLFFSYLRTSAQVSNEIAVPLDITSVLQIKSGPLGAGSSSDTAVVIGSGASGGAVTLQNSSDYASIGFSPAQQGMSPFWYSTSTGPQIPFPLWGFNTTSQSIYTLDGISLGSSTAVGSSSLAIYPLVNAENATSAVSVSFYSGGAFNNAAIAVNATVTSTPDSDETRWDWSDVNRNKSVMAVLFGDLNQTGIVLTMAEPYAMDPTAQQFSLNDRWKNVLQLGTNGDAVLGGAPAAAQYVFASSTYTTAACDTTINGTDFFVPQFLNWEPGTSAPRFVFPRTRVYHEGDTQCFSIKGSIATETYIYTYTKYQPQAQSNVYVATIHMVNPYDTSKWDTMDDSVWQNLVGGLKTSNTYRYGNGSVRTPDLKSHDLGVVGPDKAGRKHFIVPNDSNKAAYSTIITINPQHSYTIGKYGYDTWVLCPNGYFVKAFKFDTKDGASQNDGSVEPAVRCGRL